MVWCGVQKRGQTAATTFLTIWKGSVWDWLKWLSKQKVLKQIYSFSRLIWDTNIKFRFSQKGTKVWRYHQLVLTLLKKKSVSVFSSNCKPQFWIFVIDDLTSFINDFDMATKASDFSVKLSWEVHWVVCNVP